MGPGRSEGVMGPIWLRGLENLSEVAVCAFSKQTLWSMDEVRQVIEFLPRSRIRQLFMVIDELQVPQMKRVLESLPGLRELEVEVQLQNRVQFRKVAGSVTLEENYKEKYGFEERWP